MIVTARVVAMALAAACATGSGVAGASPQGPPPPPCTFTLSAPLAGSGGVTATVRSTGCAPLAVPYLTVACLQAVGGAQFCSQARGADPAQVSVPYQPGVTYTATGRGCARWAGVDPAPNCQLLGPDTVAL
jgi:hypothetical protein